MHESLQEKVARVIKEPVRLSEYDPEWPGMFEAEREHLLAILPDDLINRIEHYGSTSVPGLRAKPIIDILMEVESLDETRRRIAPMLEGHGYDYFWRPTSGDDTPPFYAWFIKRGGNGRRTHHIHMVEEDFPQWDDLLFRDYLIDHPETAMEYAALKQALYEEYGDDRVAYTEGKTEFITSVTERAKKEFLS